jgi:hypothetical protein
MSMGGFLVMRLPFSQPAGRRGMTQIMRTAVWYEFYRHQGRLGLRHRLTNAGIQRGSVRLTLAGYRPSGFQPDDQVR